MTDMAQKDKCLTLVHHARRRMDMRWAEMRAIIEKAGVQNPEAFTTYNDFKDFKAYLDDEEGFAERIGYDTNLAEKAKERVDGLFRMCDYEIGRWKDKQSAVKDDRLNTLLGLNSPF